MSDPEAPVERDVPSGPPIPTQDERTMNNGACFAVGRWVHRADRDSFDQTRIAICKVSRVTGVAAAARTNDSHRRLHGWLVCFDLFEACAPSPAKRSGTAGNLFRYAIVLDRIYGPLGLGSWPSRWAMESKLDEVNGRLIRFWAIWREGC